MPRNLNHPVEIPTVNWLSGPDMPTNHQPCHKSGISTLWHVFLK